MPDGGQEIDNPLFARFFHRFCGCHTDRDTLAAIVDAGFTIERCRGFGFPAEAVCYPVAEWATPSHMGTRAAWIPTGRRNC
ncbi:MAG TPA: hypothetical protein VFN87_22245 [Solirubrobacteraceae bacterium]|nr:hypothetical protein [Solirubrobacteraceae bacterium]